MNEVQQKLNRVYTFLSEISVSGRDVKRMAFAMQELENTFKLLNETQEQEVNDG